jgi:tRNA(Ile)-lysidine synthase
MKKQILVAVSGGVDSVVLLDILAKRSDATITVAHFDHGIRNDSAADARFVQALAERYSLPFVVKREELGESASEDLARRHRYDFLRSEAKKRQAIIVTAHHIDDVIETIAINVLRGTGWRGLAVMNAEGVERPLLGMTKAQIRTYALEHRLEWVEDHTNTSDRYLRNRIRRTISKYGSLQMQKQLAQLWLRQLGIKREIEKEINSLLSKSSEFDRYLFIMADDLAAIELVRASVMLRTGVSLTRPQLERALIAIKTAKPGAINEVGSNVRFRFSRRRFIVETP